MGAILEAYITNLGKYTEGQLVGETLKFPTTTEEVQALLKRIGVDGVRYEEIFITSFDSDVLGLHEHLGEYENIDELNYLAALLSDMDQSDLEKFEAIIDAGEYTGSVRDLINLTQNLDCFEFYSGIHSEEDLGRMYMKSVPRSEVVGASYKEKMEERRALLRLAKAEYAKAASDLEALKAEVIKTIRGESAFSKELLGSLIAEAETKCTEAERRMNEAEVDYEEGQALMASLNAQYDDIISWADMYDTASIEAKKMIVNCLIRRIDVYRDYRLHIDFNIDLEQFGLGLEKFKHKTKNPAPLSRLSI